MGEYADVPGYDGDYVVSRDGEVYSLKGDRPKKLETFSGDCGPRVCLWRNGKRMRPTVEQLLKRAFASESWHPDAELAWYIREQYWDHAEVRDWFAQELGSEPAEAEVVSMTADPVACTG